MGTARTGNKHLVADCQAENEIHMIIPNIEQTQYGSWSSKHKKFFFYISTPHGKVILS